jgi:hypothetical protein
MSDTSTADNDVVYRVGPADVEQSVRRVEWLAYALATDRDGCERLIETICSIGVYE